MELAESRGPSELRKRVFRPAEAREKRHNYDNRADRTINIGAPPPASSPVQHPFTRHVLDKKSRRSKPLSNERPPSVQRRFMVMPNTAPGIRLPEDVGSQMP